MKSNISDNKIYFDELIDRLRVFIRARINSGEFTERSLARTLRVSQPHLHNMLKGARNISPEFADHVLEKFRISVLDLVSEEEILQFLDDHNQDWLARAAKRKPATKSTERESDPRAEWLKEIRGS